VRGRRLRAVSKYPKSKNFAFAATTVDIERALHSPILGPCYV
jgi:hypothetical protein